MLQCKIAKNNNLETLCEAVSRMYIYQIVYGYTRRMQNFRRIQSSSRFGIIRIFNHKIETFE